MILIPHLPNCNFRSFCKKCWKMGFASWIAETRRGISRQNSNYARVVQNVLHLLLKKYRSVAIRTKISYVTLIRNVKNHKIFVSFAGNVEKSDLLAKQQTPEVFPAITIREQREKFSLIPENYQYSTRPGRTKLNSYLYKYD